MPKRKSTDRVTLTLRLREPLRQHLETKARRYEWSLNTEIVRRLEASIRDDKLGEVLFRDSQMYQVMDTLARLIRAIELDTGQRWDEDRGTYDRAVETIYALLKHGPGFTGTGTWNGDISNIADQGALMAVEHMFAVDDERRAQSLEDTPQAHDAATKRVAERREE